MPDSQPTPSRPEPDATQLTPFSTTDGGKRPDIVDTNVHETPKSLETAEPSAEGRGEPVDKPVEDIPVEPADLARNALADARRIARRPGTRGDSSRAAKTRRENLAGRRPGGYSAPGADPARDPQPVGVVFKGYVAEREWQRSLAEARVFADWAGLVGSDVAAHCAPQALRSGELRIGAESTAWATQLRLLGSTLLARLVAELGPEVVTRLVVTGPTGPSWKHGGRSVRGALGPRDTYG